MIATVIFLSDDLGDCMMRLRRELEIMRQERDILKKVSHVHQDTSEHENVVGNRASGLKANLLQVII